MDASQDDRRKQSRGHRPRLPSSSGKHGSVAGSPRKGLSPSATPSSTDQEQVQSGERGATTTAPSTPAASLSRFHVAQATKSVTSTPQCSRGSSLGSSPLHVGAKRPTNAVTSTPLSSREFLGLRAVDEAAGAAPPTMPCVATAKTGRAGLARSSEDVSLSTKSPNSRLAPISPLKSCLAKTSPACVDGGISVTDDGPRIELMTKPKPRSFFFACIAVVIPFVLLVIFGAVYHRRTLNRSCRFGDEDLLVNTTLGLLKGIRAKVEKGLEARAFLGIPFGVGVSGQQRFGIAWQVTKVDSPFSADKQGPACLQPEVNVPGLRPIAATSDDCLSLNIWTPTGCSLNGESLPVLFFISAWMSYGVSWNGLYDWRYLVSRGRVVVVAPNFRLGAVGFLHRSGIGPENLGVRDILGAWRWTREHIASFGGDAGNIVPVGHGTGGVIVSALLTRPELSEASRAIILSQSVFAPLLDNSGAAGLATTKRIGQLCCEASRCADDTISAYIQCLAHLPAAGLQKLLGARFMEPQINIRGKPLASKTENSPNKIRMFAHRNLLLVSSLYDADRLAGLSLESFDVTNATVREIVVHLLGDFGLRDNRILEFVVNKTGAGSGKMARSQELRNLFDFLTNGLFHCPMVQYAEEASTSGASVRYLVLAEKSLSRLHGITRAALGDDLLYMSGDAIGLNMTDPQKNLSFAVMDYVASFAKSGDPGNLTAGDEWPPWTEAEKRVLVLNSTKKWLASNWLGDVCPDLMSRLAVTK